MFLFFPFLFLSFKTILVTKKADNSVCMRPISARCSSVIRWNIVAAVYKRCRSNRSCSLSVP